MNPNTAKYADKKTKLSLRGKKMRFRMREINRALKRGITLSHLETRTWV
jgi:hypothetical protein